MTTYTILYWQEIPSFVEATDGESTSKAQLSDRFQDLIDKAAMRRNLTGTDAYLEGFNRGAPVKADGTPSEVVASVTEKLESTFKDISKAALTKPDS